MRVTGEFLITARNCATVDEQLCAVVKRVLHRIRVEILIDAVTAIVTSAAGFATYGPRILHPAGFINVVNQEVADRSAAQPEKSVKTADLVQQLAHTFRLWSCRRSAGWASHAIGTHHGDVADFAVLNAVEQFTTCFAVTAHQADANLQVFRNRLVIQRQHSLALSDRRP